MKEELFYRGQHNIEDANFVKGTFIPSALKKKKWNVVVYDGNPPLK